MNKLRLFSKSQKIYFPKHVELTGITNNPLLLHLVGCLYYLYPWCTVKHISGNEIHLLTNYIRSVLWSVAKRLSYIEDTWCLNANDSQWDSTIDVDKYLRNGKVHFKMFMKYFGNYFTTKNLLW